MHNLMVWAHIQEIVLNQLLAAFFFYTKACQIYLNVNMIALK